MPPQIPLSALFQPSSSSVLFFSSCAYSNSISPSSSSFLIFLLSLLTLLSHPPILTFFFSFPLFLCSFLPPPPHPLSDFTPSCLPSPLPLSPPVSLTRSYVTTLLLSFQVCITCPLPFNPHNTQQHTLVSQSLSGYPHYGRPVCRAVTCVLA